MRSLLATGTRRLGTCLGDQLNTLAARGSCQAPWTANGGLLVKFNPQKIGLPKRVNIIAQRTESARPRRSRAARQQRHPRLGPEHSAGSESPLRPRLRSRVTNQFKYDVNQRFGSTRPQQSSDARAAVHQSRVQIRHRAAARAATAHATSGLGTRPTRGQAARRVDEATRHELDSESDGDDPPVGGLARSHASAGR